MEQPSALRPMSTSQILDRSFSLYRNNFVLFAGIAMLPPVLLLIGQSISLFLKPVAGALTANFGTLAGVIIAVILYIILYLIGSALAHAATVYAVSRIHLGDSATIGESYGAVQPMLGRIVLIILRIALMSGGAFLLGYAALFIPMFALGALMRQVGGGTLLIVLSGIMGFGALVGASIWAVRIYCRYSVAVPACVVENTSTSGGLKRSKFLTHHSLGSIFLIYLLMGILAFALSLALSIPNYLVMGFRQSAVQPLALQIWSLVSGFLAGTLAGPVATIAISLVYFDARVRKEAFDLQLMMQAIGQPPQASAASPSIG